MGDGRVIAVSAGITPAEAVNPVVVRGRCSAGDEGSGAIVRIDTDGRKV
jgi:hypothetical protein